jgi:glycosyltransferase involved in cell wall biosynthesis
MISFVFVDTERVWRGGQDQLFALLKGLHRRGHKVHLICQPRTLLETRSREYGLFVHPVSIRSEVDLLCFPRLLSVLRRIHPDILAFNTPRAVLLGSLASRMTRVGSRIIFRRVNFPPRKGFFTLMKYTWGADCIVAISESIRMQLQLCGIPSSKIRTIYEGMDLSLYPRRTQARPRQPEEPAVVGTVAHLSPEKGLHYLVEAASMIPGVREKMRFLIVGHGQCRQELEDLVRQKGLQGVFHFAGFHADISPFMKSFDIFALPSLSEGLSSAILEAMAASLPIVASEVGGIPELVTSGINGLLVAPADPGALARAIQQLAANPEEALRMGHRSRERMEARFTLERKILETEQLCMQLLQKQERAPRSAHV